MIKISAQENQKAENKKLYGLDHLRAFAITIVFLYHYGGMFAHPEWVSTISRFGWTGVDLFFVLSGYLIASQLFKEVATRNKISFKTFFLKRFFRIVPAYLVVVAIYFYLPYVREREALAPLWKYLTFTQNLGLDLRNQGTFSQAWSLCIEEQFYLVLPLILLLLISLHIFKRGSWLLLALFALGFVARIYCYQNFVQPFAEQDNMWVYWYKVIYYPTYSRLDGLLTGVGIAAMAQFLPVATQRIMKSGNLLFICSLCILAGAYFLCLDQKSFTASVFSFPLISIGYGVMVTAALSPSCFLYKINSKTTTTIATLSYGIYLTHKFLIHIAQGQFKKLHIAEDSNGMFILCITVCVLGAILLNKTIEKPFLRLRNRILWTPGNH